MHEKYMQMALDLAHKGVGRTAPNPPVGAVLVHAGQVVGRGYHPAAGQPHAEIFALCQAGEKARGADLYVTLEPCCHQGRTGPCTEALIEAGVRRVMVGTRDPNPQVAGQGLQRLQEAGLEVHAGLLEQSCRRLIAPFSRQVLAGRPFVIFKAAMSLDGKTATAGGQSQWISCDQSRQRVQQLRDQVDAILVGSRTVLADNPRLTTRLPQGGRDPVRIVVDGDLVTDPESAVYHRNPQGRTLLITAGNQDSQRLQPYQERGVDIIGVSRCGDHLDLVEVMHRLSQRNLQAILLEGGATLAGAMLRGGLVDRVMLFVAPLLFGGGDGQGLFSGLGVQGLAEAFRLTDLRVDRSGEDILIEGEVVPCLPD